MSKQLKLKSFLRNLDLDLLHEYFEQKDIQVTFPNQDDKNDPLVVLEANIQELPETQMAVVESNFIDIGDLATEGGILSLLELAQNRHELAAKIGSIENAHNKALYCFLHDPQLFKEASVLYYIADLQSKAERVGLKQLTNQEVIGKGDALSKVVSSYLSSEEGRGKNCEVEVYEFPDRVCFIAHPENYPESDFCYEATKLKRVTRKPSFEIVYVYYPEGKVELAARGGKKRQLALFNAFNHSVLEDVSPVPDTQVIYDLGKILNPEFELVLDPADQLEQVALKQLRLSSKYNIKNRITFEVDGGKGVETMLGEVKHHNIDPERYYVTQATFTFKFPGSGNKGKVTMQLTNPDRNNLKDAPNHQRVKKYIQSWGLFNESEIRSATT